MSSLTVWNQGKAQVIPARDGESLLSALTRAELAVSAPCGGQGRCGKCTVVLLEGAGRREVLACKTPVSGDMALELPDHSGGVILTEAGTGTKSLRSREGLGLAVDLGTTTVAAELLDLQDGRSLGTMGRWNVQAAYGGDVISRTQYILSHPEGLGELCHRIRRQIADMAAALCRTAGREISELREAVVAGNTIMQHIFAERDPSPIARAPYVPDTLFLEQEPLFPLELPGVTVYLAPCVAGYVGGDITAGLLAAEVRKQPGLTLFLDIGTNGEMALCRDGELICCSVASGPAFEGAEISCGMASSPGAVSHVTLADGRFQPEIIGGGTAKGLCGSGLIDLLALLLDTEIVDETGRLLPPEEAPDAYLYSIREDGNGNGVFSLTPEVQLTAGDVRKLQLAKAAVAAGVEILLQEAGKKPEDVDALLLAGGFGAHLRPESAARIGMFPSALADKVRCMGNSSLRGAGMLLRDPKQWENIRALQQRCRYLELSGNDDFTEAYVDHMGFDEEF